MYVSPGSGKPPNEIGIFNLLVGRMGSDGCIDAGFVSNFMSVFPGSATETETVLLAAQLADAAIQPAPRIGRLKPKPSGESGGHDPVCPACHGRSSKDLQPQTMTPSEIDALQTLPTCAAVTAQAIAALRSAVKNLPPRPREQTVHPAYAPPAKPPRAANEHESPPGYRPPDSRSHDFPTEQEQLGTVCPNCHAQNKGKEVWRDFGPGFGTGPNGAMTDADYKRLADFARSAGP